MRRWLAILLFTFLLLDLAGVFVFFKGQQGIIRHQMSELLNDESAEPALVFHFTSTAFNGLPRPDGNGNELLIDGELYDIKTIATNGDKVTVYVYRDWFETDLLRQFTDWIGNGSKHKSHHPIVQSFFMPYYAMEVYNWGYTLPVEMTSLHSETAAILAGCTNGIIIPPPNSDLRA